MQFIFEIKQFFSFTLQHFTNGNACGFCNAFCNIFGIYFFFEQSFFRKFIELFGEIRYQCLLLFYFTIADFSYFAIIAIAFCLFGFLF